MLAALHLLLLAMARPSAEVSLPSRVATVMLVMDVSGSMRATDVNPSRIVAAQTAAKDYIKDQPRDVRIGIVAFAATALLVQTPTTDHAGAELGHRPVRTAARHRGGQRHPGGAVHPVSAGQFPDQPVQFAAISAAMAAGAVMTSASVMAAWRWASAPAARPRSMSRSSPAPTRMRW